MRPGLGAALRRGVRSRGARALLACAIAVPLVLPAVSLGLAWPRFGGASGSGTVAEVLNLGKRGHVARLREGGEIPVVGVERSLHAGSRLAKKPGTLVYLVDERPRGGAGPFLLDRVLLWSIAGAALAALALVHAAREGARD